MAKNKLVMDIVESFMSANMPLEKLNNPKLHEFFKAQSKTTDLCQMPTHSDFEEAARPEVIVNETNDMRGCYVAIVWMHPLNSSASKHCKALLVNTEILMTVNNVGIPQLTVRRMTNMNVELNNILALVSDNAALWKSASRTAYVEYCQTQHMLPSGSTLFIPPGMNFMVLLKRVTF